MARGKVQVWNQARSQNGSSDNSITVGYTRLQWSHTHIGGHEQHWYSCNQVQWGVTSLPLPYHSVIQFLCGSYQWPKLNFLSYSFQCLCHITGLGLVHTHTHTHKHTHIHRNEDITHTYWTAVLRFHTPSRLVDDGCEQNVTLFRKQITFSRWEKLTFSLS